MLQQPTDYSKLLTKSTRGRGSEGGRRPAQNLKEGVRDLAERLIIDARSAQPSTKLSQTRKQVAIDTAQMAIWLMMDFGIPPKLDTLAYAVIKHNEGSVQAYIDNL